jgi:hypothetical protein
MKEMMDCVKLTVENAEENDDYAQFLESDEQEQAEEDDEEEEVAPNEKMNGSKQHEVEVEEEEDDEEEVEDVEDAESHNASSKGIDEMNGRDSDSADGSEPRHEEDQEMAIDSEPASPTRSEKENELFKTAASKQRVEGPVEISELVQDGSQNLISSPSYDQDPEVNGKSPQVTSISILSKSNATRRKSGRGTKENNAPIQELPKMDVPSPQPRRSSRSKAPPATEPKPKKQPVKDEPKKPQSEVKRKRGRPASKGKEQDDLPAPASAKRGRKSTSSSKGRKKKKDDEDEDEVSLVKSALNYLEKAIPWSAVDETWAKEAPKWQKKLQRSTTKSDNDLVDLIVQFSRHIIEPIMNLQRINDFLDQSDDENEIVPADFLLVVESSIDWALINPDWTADLRENFLEDVHAALKKRQEGTNA